MGTLQRALANVQLASDRRLTMEKRVRAQLEKEIENLKREKVSSDYSTFFPRKNVYKS